jgi:hypothetical protein
MRSCCLDGGAQLAKCLIWRNWLASVGNGEGGVFFFAASL